MNNTCIFCIPFLLRILKYIFFLEIIFLLNMAVALKHWRESASLIIASKKMAMKQPNPNLLKKLMKTQPEQIENKNEEFLRLLLLKRKPGSSFMPSMYVFPGGASDKSDFSREWLDLIGCKNNNLLHLFTRGKTGSPIFSTIRESPFCDVPSEIALRITAIRETFEESGILLGRPMTDLQDLPLSSLSAHPICSTYCNLPTQVSLEWRKQVISDSSNFIHMCNELKMVPDIWSLYEWSNWLTPLLQNARFDTAFFLCCVDEAPLILDSNETEDGAVSLFIYII